MNGSRAEVYLLRYLWSWGMFNLIFDYLSVVEWNILTSNDFAFTDIENSPGQTQTLYDKMDELTCRDVRTDRRILGPDVRATFATSNTSKM